MSLIWPEIEDNYHQKKKMETVYINRYKSDNKQTMGEMVYNGKVIAKTLELAWRDNEHQISCIPTGIYHVVRRWTSKYGNHFWIKDVPNRDMILIHHGNFHFNVLGCILVGKEHIDINYDGYKDVTASKVKMRELNKILPFDFELKII
jgi:hypothetical protein